MNKISLNKNLINKNIKMQEKNFIEQFQVWEPESDDPHPSATLFSSLFI